MENSCRPFSDLTNRVINSAVFRLNVRVTLLNETLSCDTPLSRVPEGVETVRISDYRDVCLVEFDNDMAEFNDSLEVFYSVF